MLKHFFFIVADIVPCLITYFCLTFCLKNRFNKNYLYARDHVPVQLAINYTDSIASSNIVNEQSSTPKPKVNWSKFTKDEINENYTTPFFTKLINIDLDLLNGVENDVNAVTNLILTNSKSLAASIYHKKNKRKN